MKQVKIKTQLYILFIPFINTLILPIWVFINLRNNPKLSFQKEMLITFLLMALSLVAAIPLIIIHREISRNYTEFLSNYELIMYYIWSTLSMTILVFYQKKKGLD